MWVEAGSFHDAITEICIACLVLLAVCLTWLERLRSKKGGRYKGKQKFKSMVEAPDALCKQLEALLSTNGSAKVLSTWRALQPPEVVSARALKILVQAFVEVEPESLVSEICEQMKRNCKLRTLDTVASILDIMARAGQIGAMEDFLRYMRMHHLLPEDEQIDNVRLGAFAFAGQLDKCCDLMSRIRASGRRISPRGYCLIIKGLLKNDMTQAAWDQLKAMHRQGLPVPSFAVTKICNLASSVNDSVRLVEDIENYGIPISSADVTVLMKDCQKRNDLKGAFRVEKIAHICKAPLMMNAYDAFLMLCVSHGNEYSFKLFEKLQKVGTPSLGLCLGLIARCPESKFCRFAEMMVNYLRKSNDMSIQAYIALMKVYASCGMYNKACDLYGQIVKEGLQPDSVMYGCLMNFAVACGRTELAQELSQVAPHLHIQNYMSLIKAAGRDKDIDRAFRLLEEMKNSGVTVDITAYSCVLDVCVQIQDMERAKDLLKEMQKTGTLDVVAYNTMLKGYCKLGDNTAAKALLSEMDAAGVKPNDVSFNCLINATAATGNFKEAWSLVEMMASRGLCIDKYTMSTLMKVLKHSRYPHPKDVAKAFKLLDCSVVDILDDEILLNGVLETCTRHRQMDRLQSILSRYIESKLRPSMHTTGLLIKASGMLKQTETCREFWKDLIENRKVAPNNYVLCYMLDALVSNDCIEEAVSLLKKWETKVAPSAYLYSTILKGLANIQKSGSLTEVYEEMKKKASEVSRDVQTR